MNTIENTAANKTILIANGVNLDLLGRRDKKHYGHLNLSQLERSIQNHWQNHFSMIYDNEVSLKFFQSNHEGDYLEILDKPWLAAILNPGAWTHTSLALADRLEALNLPFVEVHLSQIHAREDFRKHSYLSRFAIGSISGFGIESYLLALQAIHFHLGGALKKI